MKLKFDDIKLDGLQKLEFCAYLRNVSCLPHRTINEFAWFCNDTIWGDMKKTNEFYWDDENRGTIISWIDGFLRYCIKEYNATEEDYDKFIQSCSQTKAQTNSTKNETFK